MVNGLYLQIADIKDSISLSGRKLSGKNISFMNSMQETWSHLYCRHA
jgi:hypothetical protein